MADKNYHKMTSQQIEKLSPSERQEARKSIDPNNKSHRRLAKLLRDIHGGYKEDKKGPVGQRRDKVVIGGLDDSSEEGDAPSQAEPETIETPEEPEDTTPEGPNTISLGSALRDLRKQKLTPDEEAERQRNLHKYIHHAGEAEASGRSLQSYLPKKESYDISDNIDILLASTYMSEIANINDDQFIIEHVILGLEEELQVELSEEEIFNILENIDEEMLLEAKKKGPSGISGMIQKLAVKMGYNPKEKRKSGDVVQMIKNLAKGKGLKTDRGLKPRKARKSTPRKPKQSAKESPSQEEEKETPKGPPPETRKERMIGSDSAPSRAVDQKNRVDRVFQRVSEETNENYEIMADKIINALQNEINESFTIDERQILREILVEEIKNEK